MLRPSRTRRCLSHVLVVTLFACGSAPLAAAAEDPEPLPLASTVTGITDAATSTFVDTSFIGKDGTGIVGKWIRFFTTEKPAGFITRVTAFDSDTGTFALLDPIPAGQVKVHDAYHLADDREVLLPSSVDPATIGLDDIGCTPAGTANADTITCLGIDTTGVDAKAGDDQVAVTSPTIVLVTKFGSPEKDASEEDKAKSEARAIALGDGDDQFVNDGTVVAAAIAVVSESPGTPTPGQQETKAAAKAEPSATGIDGGAGQNIITNNGTFSTSATAILLARQVPGKAEEQKNTDVSSAASATSSGIESGDGGSFITNTGSIASRAIAIAAGLGISASAKDETNDQSQGEATEPKGGDFTFKGDVSATATASGIKVGDGNDTVTNTDTITVTGWAVSLDAGGTMIEAKGSAGASASSSATSTAQALALGGGDDTLVNTGALETSATSRAIAIEMAVAQKTNPPASGSGSGGASASSAEAPGDAPQEPPQEPKETAALSSTVDASVNAKATATGIVTDGADSTDDSDPIFTPVTGGLTLGRESTETRESGRDTVNNSGTIEVTAKARSDAGAGALTIDGNATVKTSSTAAATSLAIDMGGGDDTLTNSGTLTASAESVANAVTAAVAQKATATSPTPTPTPPPAGAAADEPPTGEEPPTGGEPKTENTVAIKSVIEGSATATSTATGITADGALSSQSDAWAATVTTDPTLHYTRTTTTTQASGDDTVANSGTIGVTATSTTRAATVGLAIEGGTTAKATSTAEATALGIDLGGGDDTLTNATAGQLTTSAEATANALALAVGVKTDPSAKADVESAAETGASATARATGATADGLQADTTRTVTLGLGGGEGLSLRIDKATALASGDDTVTNNGDIVTTATATTRAAGIAVTVDGKATTSVTSEAEALATGIDLGGGHDTLTSTGSIGTTATATANGLGVTVAATSGTKSPSTPSTPSTPPPAEGETGSASAASDSSSTDTPTTPTPPALASSTDVGVTATANALGLSADSTTADTTRNLTLQLGGGVASSLELSERKVYATGNDVVTNDGTIDATATATSRAIDTDVTIDGKAAAKLTSSADATAAAINLGGGNDTLTNESSGAVTAAAEATASGRAAAVGVKTDSNATSTAESVVNASVDAEALAVGIASDGALPDVMITGTLEHLEGVLTLTLEGSRTRASGDDTLANHATVVSTATARTDAAGVALAIDGSTASKQESTATASAAAIDGGGGHDTITNTGQLTATATGDALSLAIGLGVHAQSTGSSTGTANATAGDTPTETPPPVKTATSTKSTVDGSVTSKATATGLSADSLVRDATFEGSLSFVNFLPQIHLDLEQSRASGDDTVTNSGAITANVDATSAAGTVGASIGGQTTAKLSSTAEALAVGIDLGGGHDTLTDNTGQVTVTADATASGLGVAVVAKDSSSSASTSRARSTVNTDVTAEARATGLAADGASGDQRLTLDLTIADDLVTGVTFNFLKAETHASGDDTLTNSAAIDARATATTNAGAVSIGVESAAAAKTSASAETRAAAIDLGGGSDVLTNDATLVAVADSTARALSVAFTTKGTATSVEGQPAASEGLWKGGVEAEAESIGIDAAGAANTSTTIEVGVNLVTGANLRIEILEGNLEMIEGQAVPTDGADTITNRGDIDARATADASAANVSASAEGVAAAITDVESTAAATGIRGGYGNDTIDNLGFDRSMSATATAAANAGTVAVSGKGLALAADTVWSTGTQAEAAAIGIDGDGGAIDSTVIAGHYSFVQGAELVIEKSRTGATGNDTILNEQSITAAAGASVPSLGVAVTAGKGVAAAVSNVEAEATATGIRGGGGDDHLTNLATVTTDATAEAWAANVAVAAQPGAALAGGTLWDGGTQAEATAVGIDADGARASTKTTSVTKDADGVTIAHTKIDDGVADAGADTVINAGAITATATATSDALASGTSSGGLAVAFATSTAEATAVAIRGGADNDNVTNSGTLTSTATSTARALNVSVDTTAGGGIAGNALFDGSTTAKAQAVGIAGDGGSTKTTTLTIHRDDGAGFHASIDKETSDVAATGNDIITNNAKIGVTADATTAEASVGVELAYGVGAAISTSKAEAAAAAIDAGDGDDTMTNSGELTADATAFAVTGNVAYTNVGLGAAADAVWEGGTTADAKARGITAGPGADVVDNSGQIMVTANAETGGANVAVTLTGAAVALGTATAKADASAIDGGDGASVDTIDNHARLHADTWSIAATVDVAVTQAGVAAAGSDVWDGGTKAEALTRTIRTDAGNDVITNDGDVTAGSDAITVSIPVSWTSSGGGLAIGTSTAVSRSAAIDGGAGANTVTNAPAIDPATGLPMDGRSGTLVATATTHAAAASVTITPAGVAIASDAVWDGGTTADAAARGIRTELGSDTIDNQGAIEATSTARSGSASVGTTATGVAVALANSTALSNATAIDAAASPDGVEPTVDEDVDTVTNTGTLTVNANAFAASVPVAVAWTGGVALAGNTVWDGGTTADAMATGIATRFGADMIENHGTITADADATSGSIGVSVSVAGFAASVATSTAEATAAAIDAGEDADTVINSGTLTADTWARAGTLTVGVTPAGVAVAGDAVWDGGTKATAASRTISAGDGADTVKNDGDVHAVSLAENASVAVDVVVYGVGASVATSTATSRATAIDTGTGDDTVSHISDETAPSNTLTADATANAYAANVNVTPFGVSISSDAIWRGGTMADAVAAGLDTGLGADTVTNASDIQATSTASTFAASVGVNVYGVAAALVNASSTSSATAIRTGDNVRDDLGAAVDADVESEKDVLVNTGTLTTTAEAFGRSLGIGFSFGGVAGTANALWDGGTTAHAVATGIGAGNGPDEIANLALIDTTSFARAWSASGGITVFGVSAASSTATARSHAWGIDGGDGNDTITNLLGGDLVTDATAHGVGVNVSFVAIGATAAADTVWSGGTTAEAIARGIGGGIGGDIISNFATLSSTADATTDSVSVSITGIGLGGALATSAATATSRGIDGGGDDDTITNVADVTAKADASGTGVAVSATGIGGGVSADAYFDGGTEATAVAAGLVGGAGDDTVWHLPGLPTVASLLAGTPEPTDPRTVTADATSETTSTTVSVTLGGFAGVAAGSTSIAQATAIDGGSGDDDLFVLGSVVSNATSTADGNSTSVAVTGVAAAGSLLDNATKAEAIATGVAGGDGVDTIVLSEQASATLTSHAETSDTAVTVTMVGLAAADTRAVAAARGTGLDGGAGNDTIGNDGLVTGTLTAESLGRSVGVSLTGAEGDASGAAEVTGTGLDGGAGNDTIGNAGQITLPGTATARGHNVTFTTIGGGDTDASSRADAALTGLAGGAGNDTLVNTGSIALTSNAVGDSTATSVTLIVTAFADANTTADASATGMAGGAGVDTLTNAAGATVNATADASTTARNNAVALVGAASGGARTTPAGTATGLDGGADNDTIVNDGTVIATARGESVSDGASTNLAGSAGTAAGANAHASATGMAGGLGDDTLVNRSLVTIDGFSSASSNAASWTLAGVAGDSSIFEATGSATGMAGGAGVDGIVNLGQLDVTFESRLRATGGSDAIFGGASADTQLTARASASGITGGDGVDTIRNASDIDVRSIADVATTRAEVSFAGNPDSGALLVASANTTGISGGLGDDWIRNDGAIRVDVHSISNVSGGASAKAFGGAASSGFGTANGTGVGIQGNDGANTIVNARSIDVDAFGDSFVVNSASSGLLFGKGNTQAEAKSSMNAFGVAAGSGDNTIENWAALDVSATASGYGFAYASGSHIAIKGDGLSTADAAGHATSIGISVLDGENTVVNGGVLSVSARATTVRAIRTTTSVCSQELVDTGDTDADGNPIYAEVTTCTDQEVETDPTPTYAGANGNGAAGHGTARALGTATAEAFGVRAGDGANTLVNLHEMFVTASPEGKTASFADGDLKGNATSTARAWSNGLAVGLQAGDGDNGILNAGVMSILAAPEAEASARATGGDICITFLFFKWCGGGGTGTGTAEANFDAEAIGIRTGHGKNVIVNDGLLMVAAAPAASGAPTEVTGADSRTRRTSVVSRAVGIETGNGNNLVVNTSLGVIDVEARDLQQSYTCTDGPCARTMSAIGILTGSGDDVVVNDGQLSAHTVTSDGTRQMSVAIDAGAGNDRVVLGSGSQATGAVVLGTGDDRFVWSSNASLTGAVEPGEGTDAFALGGSVSDTFQLDDLDRFPGFEEFKKEGPAVWTVAGARVVDWTVEEGSLAISGAIVGTVATDAATGSLLPTIVVNPTGTVSSVSASAPAVLLRDSGELQNFGWVGAVDGTAVQVLGQGATVVNEGQIASSGIGVDLAGQNASMTNRGVVQGHEAAVIVGGSGSFLRNDGSIVGVNAGIVAGGLSPTVANTGSILAGGSALWINSAPDAHASVVNDTVGSIRSTGGVAVLGGAGDERIVNAGLIAGGGATAIDLGAGNDELRIWGSSVIDGIAAGGDGLDTFVLAGPTGIFDVSSIGSLYTGFESLRMQGMLWTIVGTGVADWMVDQGTLQVEGNVTGTMETALGAPGVQVVVLPSGVLASADGDPAVILGGGAILSNDGTIRSTGSGGSAVVLGGETNTLVNTGLIEGLDGSSAVDAVGGGNVVLNLGMLTGDSAVVMGGRNSLLENYASIVGSDRGVTITGDENVVRNAPGALIQSLAGLAIQGGSGSERIINDGTIFSGVGMAIDFGGGDDTLELSTLARIGGTVLGGTGYDTLMLGGASSVGLDLEMFDGFEMMRKAGTGAWWLFGSANMDWDLEAGQIVLDGELGGQGIVRAGALLAGNGVVGGLTNEGTVSPGFSIGAIRVIGDYQQGAQGVLQIEAAGVTDLSDRLFVGGRAVLEGGLLELDPDSGPFGIATQYAFLEANGGVSGTFGSVTSTATYLDPVVSYGPQNVTVTLVRNDVSFSGMGDTTNLATLGATLDDSKLAMARGDFKVLMDQFLFIDGAERAAALLGLSGEVHAFLPVAMLRTGERFFSASAHRRISAQQQTGERTRVWTDFVRFGGDVDGDGNAGGASFGAGGIVGGADVVIGEVTRVGVSLGYSRGSTELDALGDDRGSVRSVMPAIYAEHVAGAWNLEGAFGYGGHSVETTRAIRVGAIARQASADYRADQFSGLARVSVKLPSSSAFTLQPFVELRYSTLTRQAFDESGAASASLEAVEDAGMRSLRSLLGVRSSWAPKLFGVTVEPQLSVAWMHEALDAQGAMTGTLGGLTTLVGSRTFAVTSALDSRDGVIFAVGTSASLSERGRAFVAYDGTATATGAEHGLTAGLRWGW